ncbi:hypothetical protein O7626_21710 [Micromonospora sp. WMMD1102]|uniref:hypothetical protein n=1 Tax=Micromonospora sp. WMMD1102 TaxID=3016105 RepID=UPI0024158417|nr:hypothetical protein [Micromonospora sp. WMMD1102]MDG4788519.1 hypothetical protein [Micromonospora sp. WMMD1102]
MRWWKVIGVASVVGVAATGVVLARAERRRRAYSPEQIRDRLRERHAAAADGATSTGGGPDDSPNKSQSSQ